MPNKLLTSAVLLTATLLVTACNSEPPKCSDENTLNLVRRILLNSLNLNLGDKEMQTVLNFEYPRATALDEKIKKYHCESKLIVGDDIQLPITYDSQLDDQSQHLVGVESISPMDRMALEKAIRDQQQKQATAQALPAVPAPVEDHPMIGRWRGRLEGDGEMEITAVPSGLKVALNVSAENCGGSIEGIAQQSGNTLTLHDRQDDQTCTVTAVLDRSRATLTEDGCMAYHGLACGFAGILEKVK